MKNEDRPALPTPEELAPAAETAGRLLAELDRLLLGRPELHRLVLAGLLAKGHLLLEGLPGVGKTALIVALSKLLDLEFKRVQFTPDLMPGDILGTHLLRESAAGHREMAFQPGPVFTNLLLADEINRASPKTQSALLEAMQEGAVTQLGTTRNLPRPFFVLASQNPIELEGTYPLPEAQLDRFLFKLEVAPAATKDLEELVATRRRGEPPSPTFTLSRDSLDALFGAMDRIALPRPVARYIARLVSASHATSPEAPAVVKSAVAYGASPRAAIGLAEAARANALLAGRPAAGFADVRAVARAVLAHRILLQPTARFDGITTARVVTELVSTTDEAGAVLPAGVALESAS